MTFRRHVLNRPSVLAIAMKEVEDDGFVTETTPSQLFSMLEWQPEGPKSKPGSLLTNGYAANLFRMIDVSGVARLVGVYRRGDDDGWRVFTNDVSYSNPWNDKSQLFSSSFRFASAA